MNFRKILSTLCLCVLVSYAFAQNGNVRGSITDANTGEAVMFANVLVKETSTGGTSDLDGSYAFSLAEGVYTLVFSYIGFADLTVTEVQVTAGKDTELHVKMSEDSQVLEEIVVTASQIKNTETAMLTLQRKALGLLDGVSTQTMKRAGDSDVGGAIKRVTGVSVEGGKHVIVRGLGDRYSKTILNGMSIPGLDPDRNSVQLDLFPTNLVDNILVYKSFTPDLPGDFTGGMVDIVTKDFPDSRTFSISAGAAYNPDMHFNSNFITYDGGSKDWLGMDDGTRELPLSTNLDIPAVSDNDPLLTTITNQFSPTMATSLEQNALNYNLAASYGNQLNFSSFDLGFTLSANYRNETEYYDDVEFNTYFKEPNPDENGLFRDITRKGQLGTRNVLWSTLGGLAIKSDRHKLAFSVLKSQNGVSRATFQEQQTFETGVATLERHALEYTERGITNYLLSGKHNFADGKLEVIWKASPTFSSMSEPDIRLTVYETSNDEFELNPSTGGGITRTWRGLDETNYAGNLDVNYSFDGIKGLESKVKVGFAGVKKERDFEILDYAFPVRRRGTIDFTGDPAELWQPENVWSPENDLGLYTIFNFEPSKTYNARQNIYAGYVMNELPVSKQVKFTYGLRVEKVENFYTGRRQIVDDPETDLYEDRKVLDELDLLPVANVVYTVSEDKDAGKTMNLRGSFSRTLARPTFKEISIAQIEDRISGRVFIGNIDLEETKINNADLRWEYYLPNAQIFSVSTFYKNFQKPIELTAFDATSPNNFTPRNVGDAAVYGIELEMRKNLDFIAPSLSALSFSFNTTIVQSSVKMTEAEFEGRILSAKTGEEISDSRQMVGQSPYLINAAINYVDSETGWEGNLSFNTQGRRLSIVGIGFVADVYEKPFDSLNFKLSKRFSNNKWKASASVGNILGSNRVREYDAFNAENPIFEIFRPGRTFSFSLGYTL